MDLAKSETRATKKHTEHDIPSMMDLAGQSVHSDLQAETPLFCSGSWVPALKTCCRVTKCWAQKYFQNGARLQVYSLGHLRSKDFCISVGMAQENICSPVAPPGVVHVAKRITVLFVIVCNWESVPLYVKHWHKPSLPRSMPVVWNLESSMKSWNITSLPSSRAQRTPQSMNENRRAVHHHWRRWTHQAWCSAPKAQWPGCLGIFNMAWIGLDPWFYISVSHMTWSLLSLTGFEIPAERAMRDNQNAMPWTSQWNRPMPIERGKKQKAWETMTATGLSTWLAATLFQKYQKSYFGSAPSNPMLRHALAIQDPCHQSQAKAAKKRETNKCSTMLAFSYLQTVAETYIAS